MNLPRFLSALPLLAVSLCATAALADWPQWRGTNRDGISPETGLLKEWPQDGPPLAWKLAGIGKGMGSVSIHGGKLFALGKRKEGQFIAAYDLATQKEAWTARVSEGGADSTGTPTVDGGQVFAVSKDGKLLCCAEADGKELWRKDFAADFGGKMMSGWGFSESPLVDGDKVIVVPGADDALMVALDRKTGALLWKAAVPEDIGNRGKAGAGYTGAVISNAAGVRQYVTLVGRGVISVNAQDGKVLWHYNRVANGTANIPTPLVWDDYVFCSSGYGTGAALLKIVKAGTPAPAPAAEATPGKPAVTPITPVPGSPVEAQEQYFLNASTFQNHHGGMVRIGDYIYAGTGHNNGFPICLEWKTGRVAWNEPRGPGKESAAVIAADGNLYFRYQDGTMALIGATPDGYALHGAFKLAAIDGPSWPHPAIQDGRLYLRSQDNLMCYDLRREK